MAAKFSPLLAVLFIVPLFAGCLETSTGRTEWAYDVTQLSSATAAGRDGRGVVIAVLDTGLNAAHPNLAHLLDGESDNGELIEFRDYMGGSAVPVVPFDDNGHGTHVVGIMAARKVSFSAQLMEGRVQLEGGAPAAQLLVARVCDGDGCDGQAIAAAIRWAISEKVDVLSLSLGGQVLLPFDSMNNAVNQAIDAGIVVVAAAGNGGPSADEGQRMDDVASPADLARVIAVGAISEDNRVAGTSSRGDNGGPNQCRNLVVGKTGRCDPNKKPEIVAPGVDILSTWTDQQYASASGTSQATPFVTAAVALMLQGKSHLSNEQAVARVKEALVSTAAALPGYSQPHDKAAGYGLLQAADALEAYT